VSSLDPTVALENALTAWKVYGDAPAKTQLIYALRAYIDARIKIALHTAIKPRDIPSDLTDADYEQLLKPGKPYMTYHTPPKPDPGFERFMNNIEYLGPQKLDIQHNTEHSDNAPTCIACGANTDSNGICSNLECDGL
jgi:hypothetical protein